MCDSSENSQKKLSRSNYQKTNFARAAPFFCTFLCRCFARPHREISRNFLVTRFMEEMLYVVAQLLVQTQHFLSCLYFIYAIKIYVRWRVSGNQPQGMITWQISVPAAISARLAGLRFQSGFWRKSSWNESGDYMEKASVRAENRAGFSARANVLKNPHEVHVIEMKCQPGL